MKSDICRNDVHRHQCYTTENFELLLLAGATLIPANPSFYSGAKTVVELVDTVVARVLDHMGLPNKLAPRWAEENE